MSNVSNASASLLVFLAAGAAATYASQELPAQIRAGDDESLLMTLHAKGVQVYECRAVKDSYDAYDWAFVAPEAELFDEHGAKVARHYAGPHWEAADGSHIIGTAKARADAPRAGAIPWLLLTASSDGAEGTFSKVKTVLRINTAGGVAPASGCSQATAGTSARVDYTADYAFYVPR